MKYALLVVVLMLGLAGTAVAKSDRAHADRAPVEAPEFNLVGLAGETLILASALFLLRRRS
jgi:hypothetical protein